MPKCFADVHGAFRETTENTVRIALGKKARQFDPITFLATIGTGRTILAVRKKQSIFTQGEPADAVFYLQKGKARLTVVSKTAKKRRLAS